MDLRADCFPDCRFGHSREYCVAIYAAGWSRFASSRLTRVARSRGGRFLCGGREMLEHKPQRPATGIILKSRQSFQNSLILQGVIDARDCLPSFRPSPLARGIYLMQHVTGKPVAHVDDPARLRTIAQARTYHVSHKPGLIELDAASVLIVGVEIRSLQRQNPVCG